MSPQDKNFTPIAQDPELLQDFLVESRGHLSNIEQQVLVIEDDPGNKDAMSSLFRSFHTIKGLAGFLELPVIEEVAHEAETLLDGARNGKRAIDVRLIDCALAARDYLSRWLGFLDPAGEGRAPDPGSPAGLLALLRNLVAEEAPVQVPVAAEIVPAEVMATEVVATAPEVTAEAPEMAVAEAPEVPAFELPREQVVVEQPPEQPKADTVVAAARADQPAVAVESSVVKINTAKLEYLVDMVGELVIAQSMLRHDPEMEALHAPRLQRKLAQLARVTGEVQKTAMAMRMVEIGGLFQRMRRLVRDLSKKSGKRAELEISGEDVELDRSLVEELADPMVHMLRNSMDHGLEMPEERVRSGKPEAGRIVLRASHQAGQIVIEVADDGRGLNRDRIRQKAIDKGLIQADAELSDSDIYALIFEAGFSTAEKVTEVSGRGVGMDVVRKQLEKLRGRVEIESTPGQGSRFLMKLPLTLAIIDGLVVKVGAERFIVPVASVREMFRPSAETFFTVENRMEMVLVRGRLLPVVRLAERLGFPAAKSDITSGLMIVGETESGQYCLWVDELLGKQEVVIKSLGRLFEEVNGLAGCAILGDGRVGLILEMNALWKGSGHVCRHS
ncbi:MAG: chemotaxis protein CheA [Acidobacteria bacterium]|nr:chemotaxis protein CheA [Acidobacteriota bacterium]